MPVNIPVVPPAAPDARPLHDCPSPLKLPLPANLLQFEELYGTDDACRAMLVAARWPHGFVCPRCQHPGGWRHAERPLIECAACGYQQSATAGTLFHGAKLPLSKLFRLLYMFVAEKDGVNNCQIQRQLGVNYDTGRLWGRKLRDALFNRDTEPLRGVVEVDETVIGGVDEVSVGRKLGPNKAWLVILCEDTGQGAGRARLEVVDAADRANLQSVIARHVSAGATVRTDGLNCYTGMEHSAPARELKLKHEPVVVGDPKTASKKLPLVHLVASLFKRYVLGTLQGSVSPGWLPWLVKEFEFRFNRRKTTRRPQLFNRILEFSLWGRWRTRRSFKKQAAFLRAMGLT